MTYDRASYTLLLEILPQSPLTHGKRNNGNEQELARKPVLIRRVNPVTGLSEAVREWIEYVSGGAFRAKLRWHAVERAAAIQGYDTMSKERLRLLLKGGHLDSSGKATSLEEIRRILEMFPLLRLFGALDNSLKITGALKVDDVTPYCAEMVNSGLISRAAGFWRGDPMDPSWPMFDVAPSRAIISDVREYYRHDLANSTAAVLLAPEARKLIEDQQAAISSAKSNKSTPKPDKEERREANESMPHRFQHIIPGTPLVSILRTAPITRVEYACLLDTLLAWKQSGAHLGGGESKGHGHCLVRVSGAFSSAATDRLHHEMSVPGISEYDQLKNSFLIHMQERAADARAWLAQ